jgi:hypothetical protein
MGQIKATTMSMPETDLSAILRQQSSGTGTKNIIMYDRGLSNDDTELTLK